MQQASRDPRLLIKKQTGYICGQTQVKCRRSRIHTVRFGYIHNRVTLTSELRPLRRTVSPSGTGSIAASLMLSLNPFTHEPCC